MEQNLTEYTREMGLAREHADNNYLKPQRESSDKYRVLNVVNRNALNGGVGSVLDTLVEGENQSEDFSAYTLLTSYDEKGRVPGPSTLANGNGKSYKVKDGALEDLVGRFDVVHVHGVPHYGILETLKELKRTGKKTKIVNTAHSSVKAEFLSKYDASMKSEVPEVRPDFEALEFFKRNGILEDPSRFSDTYWGSAIFRQEQIMTLSDVVQHMNRVYRDQIMEEYRILENPNKHIVIPNGVRRYGNSVPREKKKRLLYVGRFSSEKGIEELVDSLPSILKEHPDAEIRLAGGDKKGNVVEAYRKRFEENVKRRFSEENVESAIDRVKFLGWIGDKNELDSQYDWSDFVINPSRSESFCLTAAEALMHGRIPILTRTEALDDLYISKGIALGINEGDRNPEGIAKVVNSILHRDENSEFDHMGERGRMYASKFYSDEQMVRIQLDLFRNILKIPNN